MITYNPNEKRTHLLGREREKVKRLYDAHLKKIDAIRQASGKSFQNFKTGGDFVPIFVEAERLKVERDKQNVIDESQAIYLRETLDRLFAAMDVKVDSLDNMPPETLRARFIRAADGMKRVWFGEYGAYVRSMKRLHDELAGQDEEFVPQMVRDAAQNALRQYIDCMPEIPGDCDKVASFLQLSPQLKEASKRINEAMVDYFNAARQWQQRLSKERLQKLAGIMSSELEHAIEEEEKTKRRSIATPEEEKMLAFASYALERRRIAGEPAEKVSYDASTLEDQAEKIMDALKPLGEQRNSALLTALEKKGYLQAKEVSFLGAIIAKLYEQPPEDSSTHDQDLALCLEWLSQEYQLPEEVIKSLLPKLTSDGITRIEDALNRAIGNREAVRKQLIRENPQLLLMGATDTKRYTTLLQRIIAEGSPYVLDSGRASGEFDIEQHPASFASIEALKSLQQSLEERVRREEIQPKKSNGLDHVRQALQEEGWNANEVMRVIRGFRHGGVYHWGRRGINEGNLLANIRRADPHTDGKAIEKIIKQLGKAGAVMTDGGKFSLNPHFDKVSSSAVKKLLEYVSKGQQLE